MGPWLCSHGRRVFRSRFIPWAQNAVCEHRGGTLAFPSRLHQPGLRKAFHTSELARRERPPGFSHHIAARGGHLSKPSCQGSISRSRLTAL